MNYKPERAMLVHPTYVFTPAREPLGLINSLNRVREFRDADETPPAHVIASRRRVDGYEHIIEIAAELPDTHCVCVGNREAHLAPSMRRTIEFDHPADRLVQVRHDRVLESEGEVEESQLGTVGRLDVTLTLFMIVAWRINHMMQLGRKGPYMLASMMLELEKMIAAYTSNKECRQRMR